LLIGNGRSPFLTAAEDIKAVLWVVIFIPLIPWRYVFANYLVKHGERWK